MRRRRVAWGLLAFVSGVSIACGDGAASSYALRSRDAGSPDDPDVSDDRGTPAPHGTPSRSDAAGPRDEPDAAVDAGMRAPVGSRLPAVEDAVRTEDSRSAIDCTSVPGFTSFYAPPSLHVIGDTVYVFSVDSSEQVPRVLAHISTLEAFAFGEPTTVIHGARPMDLIAQGDELRGLAGRQFYTVELASTDGATFEEAQQIGPHEPTYNCEGYPPPHYFRGRDPAELLVVGSDYNTGLFGCYERVFVSRREAGAWAEPVEVGRGDAIYAYQGDARALIVTTGAVLESVDGGATFTAVAGLDAAGGAFTGSRLVLARAVPDGVLALESEDDGETWLRQTRVLTEPSYGGALIAADGPALAMLVASATELVLSASFDDAATWTEPERLPRADGQRLLGLAQSGDTTLWLTAHPDDSLELCRLR